MTHKSRSVRYRDRAPGKNDIRLARLMASARRTVFNYASCAGDPTKSLLHIPSVARLIGSAAENCSHSVCAWQQQMQILQVPASSVVHSLCSSFDVRFSAFFDSRRLHLHDRAAPEQTANIIAIPTTKTKFRFAVSFVRVREKASVRCVCFPPFRFPAL